MVFVEKRNINGVIYYYHSRNFKINSKTKKISNYIGKDKAKAYNYDEIKNSIKILSQKETEKILTNYSLNDLTYSKNNIERTLYNNIYYSQILDFDENKKKEINFLFNLYFIYNSNSIEGSRIPFSEVNNILKSNKSTYKDKNEIQEVLNSIECKDFLENNFKFNLLNIKKLHQILTKNLLYNGKKYVQGFKKNKIVVGFDQRETTHPSLIKKELNDLFIWYKKNKKTQFPLKLAFDFYFKFELIHPFEDGNGRIGRMLMNKVLVDLNFLPMIIFVENSQSHHRSFVRGENGNMKYYYDFMFKQYKKTFEKFYFSK